MKIGEARKYYTEQLSKLHERQEQLQKRLKEQDTIPLAKEEQGVILELSDRVQKSIDTTQNFLNSLGMLEMNLRNAENARQQSEKASEAYSDLAKCIETARRIASGAKVPAKDEQKLMEFSMEMYLAAKNAAMLEKNPDKEYDSLWEDEEESDGLSAEDIEKKTADHELPIAAPSVSVPSIDIEV